MMNYQTVPSSYQPAIPVERIPICYQQPMIQQPVYQPLQYVMSQSQQPIYMSQQLYQQPIYVPQDRQIVMTGTNPIRGQGMYTSMPSDICSQYGSSSVQPSPQDFYGGSRWCSVGVVTSDNRVHALEARYRGNAWEMRVKDPLTGLAIYLNTIGNGPYGAFRNNDTIQIPGKSGIWQVQIQVQENPYILYVP